jgi:SagB-type dehydrogenase family enzyme
MKSYDDMIRERRMLLKHHDIGYEEWEPHQRKGIPPPPLEKPYPENSNLTGLMKPHDVDVVTVPLIDAIKRRQSHRKFTDDSLTLEELSFLLWATQGVKSVDENKVNTKRTVPSGGARHPFETYLIVNRVKGVEPGVYRYLPIEHKLLSATKGDSQLPDRISTACYRQTFIGKSAVVFVWSAIPYRTEWRYSIVGYKDILIEAGHICQNLYLACEAIGAGTCAIAAYDQKAMDALIGVDGEDEFTVYLAPVGKVHKTKRED